MPTDIHSYNKPIAKSMKKPPKSQDQSIPHRTRLRVA